MDCWLSKRKATNLSHWIVWCRPSHPWNVVFFTPLSLSLSHKDWQTPAAGGSLEVELIIVALPLSFKDKIFQQLWRCSALYFHHNAIANMRRWRRRRRRTEVRGCDADMETSTLPPVIYHPPPLSVIVSRAITAAELLQSSELPPLHTSCSPDTHKQDGAHRHKLLHCSTAAQQHTEKIIYEAETEIGQVSLSHLSQSGGAWSGLICRLQNIKFPCWRRSGSVEERLMLLLKRCKWEMLVVSVSIAITGLTSPKCAPRLLKY